MPTRRLRWAWVLSVLGRCLLCSGALLLASPTSAAVGFAGVSLDLASQTVPPGGLLQMQVFITEPKPILKGGQKASFSARAALVSPLTTVRDGALFSPAGDVDGVAVLGRGTIQVTFNSPLNRPRYTCHGVRASGLSCCDKWSEGAADARSRQRPVV